MTQIGGSTALTRELEKPRNEAAKLSQRAGDLSDLQNRAGAPKAFVS